LEIKILNKVSAYHRISL